jgi:hypothetical protein
MQITNVIHDLERAGLFYTERQLYYAVCREYVPAPVRAMLARLRWAPFTLPVPISFARFTDAFAAWCAQHGQPPGLLREATPAAAVSLTGREPDLTAYAFAKVLLCQSTALAAMLRANGATMEFGCPILAADEPLPAAIADGLARAPAARALLLHDASPTGLQAGATCAAFLPANVRLMPLGLRPVHAARMHLFAQRNAEATLNRPVPSDLTGAEQHWLAGGWTAEVAAVPPIILLRVLRHGLSGAPPQPTLRERLRRLPTAGFMHWPTS